MSRNLKSPQNIGDLFQPGEVLEHYNLEGEWKIVGKNPLFQDNKPYEGILQLTKADHFYRGIWKFERGKAHIQGIGLILNDIISFNYQHGIAIYEIIGENTLRGCWILPDMKSKGFEECTRIKVGTT